MKEEHAAEVARLENQLAARDNEALVRFFAFIALPYINSRFEVDTLTTCPHYLYLYTHYYVIDLCVLSDVLCDERNVVLLFYLPFKNSLLNAVLL